MFFTEAELTKKPKGAVGIDPSSLKRLEYVAPCRQFCADPMALPFGDTVGLDTENYVNYNLIAFKHFASGQYFFMERPFDLNALRWALSHFKLVTFNGIGYDMPILNGILKGYTEQEVKAMSDDIIINDNRLRVELPFNHIDIMEVCPLKGSQKLYAARLHSDRIQELPIDPHRVLTPEQKLIVRDYCFNDLDCLELVYNELRPHIILREDFARLYKTEDLRSKSDAQMAECVIRAEMIRVTGKRPQKPGSAAGKVFCYQAPDYIHFTSPTLSEALASIQTTPITVGISGHVECPREIEGRKMMIGGRAYTIGMGGLHSNEKKQGLTAKPGELILDTDVTGYYVNLMLGNNFYPAHLGSAFLEALRGIVDRRTKAKHDVARMKRDKMPTSDAAWITANTEMGGLKIASLGCFGKTSDPFSIMYDPPMMVQTTLTGQLDLLMFIERLTIGGFEVVSANTDGIVIICPESRYDEFVGIRTQWERDTRLDTEETRYNGIYARDVNAYYGLMDGDCKVKGAYSDKGSALNSPLSTNPEVYVCSMAVQAFLTKGVPVEQTIRDCYDIKHFVSIKNATGGAYKDGYYLGKLVRWYYGTKATKGPILKCKSGHAVPDTEGAVPLMQLPPLIPSDIDLDWYINKANSILVDIGYTKPQTLL